MITKIQNKKISKINYNKKNKKIKSKFRKIKKRLYTKIGT